MTLNNFNVNNLKRQKSNSSDKVSEYDQKSTLTNKNMT